MYEATMKVCNLDIVLEQIYNACIVRLYNGAECIQSETYLNVKGKSGQEKAIENSLQHRDIYTMNYLFDNLGHALKKISENTYRVDNDYFCRIDDTCYFKHLVEPASGWCLDRNGSRVIDR